MLRRPSIALGCFYALILVAGIVLAREKQAHQLSSPDTYVDIVGDVDGTHLIPQKVLQDTVWIATWTFDSGACDGSLPAGWAQGDNYIRTGNATGGNFVEPGATPSVYWSVDAAHSGQHLISGNAARLGYIDDCCAANPSGGYAYGWYQGLRFNYEADGGAGVEQVTFDYLLDSEQFDDLRVESDENCASFDTYDPDMTGPNFYPGQIGSDIIRDWLYEDNGLNLSGTVTVELLDYGAGPHCFYIAFSSDSSFDPWDGDLTPTLVPGAALVVDNVAITDASGTKTVDFAGGFGIATPLNMHDAKNFNTLSPSGSFARTYKGITDNDLCTWNTTCAILNTDDQTPSIDPTLEYNAPGDFVMRNWLDDVIISPWVSLDLGPANTEQTFVQFRRFPGNKIIGSQIVQNWSIRGGFDVDDGMGGTIPCTQNWGHVFQWNTLGTFRWITSTFDASINFEPNSDRVQLRFRQSDWQWIVGTGPWGFEPGPGPHMDRIRIGRRVITGPVLDEGIDARSQAQDAFATEIHPLVTPAGEHHRPRSDHSRFGTVAFSQGADLGIGNNSSPHIVTGDSITCTVLDVRGAGGITSIGICAAIVLGPHAGLAPPPHIVDSNTGLFCVAASQSLTADGTPIEGVYFVDLDDEYFVGGDEMHYFWFATDAAGGFSSLPVGLNAMPANLQEAQGATQGLFQVNFLPTNNWDQDYVDAVAVSNKVDPNSNPIYLDESSQANCILYVNHHNWRRRSGDVNRASFMYALDQLGYKDHYDVYDHTGMGSTNNHLGGRATVQQAEGYRLIVYDTGNTNEGAPLMPAGHDSGSFDVTKVEQDSWFQAWLHNGGVSEAGQATLWLLGKDLLDEDATLDLYSTECGTSWVTGDQGVSASPDSEAQPAVASYMFQDGIIVDFTDGAESRYTLAGGCPTIEDYDGQAAVATGVNAYLFSDPGSTAEGDASIVLNSNSVDGFNTIFMSHAWGDIREEAGSTPIDDSAGALMEHFLAGVLGDCAMEPTPTGAGGELPHNAAPAKTVLHANRPNPFNPMTTISFDIAQDGLVNLRVFDVSGRLVRTLVDRSMGRNRHQVVWDGLDDAGVPVSSGMYLYRFETGGYRDTRKMVVLR